MDKKTQKELLDIVKRNYEQIADDFNETRKKYLWPELIKLSEKVKIGDRIMDAGCGNGRLLEAFVDKKIDYMGIDGSDKLIELAKARFAGEGRKFTEGDIMELSRIPDINFDYIFCVAVLQHIPGRKLQINTMKQLKNKIGENGRIIITVWNLWSQKKYRKLILKFFLLKLIGKNKMDFGDILFDWKNSEGKVVSKRYYHAFRARELKKLIKKSGLKIEKIYKDKYNYYAIIKK